MASSLQSTPAGRGPNTPATPRQKPTETFVPTERNVSPPIKRMSAPIRKRPEDQADEPSENADCGPGRDGGGGAKIARSPHRLAARSQEVEAEDQQRDADRPEQDVAGYLPREQPAEHRADDRRRGHPREDAPVDPARADVRDGCGQRRDRRDADVCPGSGGRARRGQHDHGQPDVPEHEPDETPGSSRDEAPERDKDEEQRVQAVEYRR